MIRLGEDDKVAAVAKIIAEVDGEKGESGEVEGGTTDQTAEEAIAEIEA